MVDIVRLLMLIALRGSLFSIGVDCEITVGYKGWFLIAASRHNTNTSYMYDVCTCVLTHL